MKELLINDYNYKNVFKDFSSYLDSPLIEICDEESIQFNNEVGKGVISGINQEFGLGTFMIDATFHEDILIKFSLGRRHPILFINNVMSEIIIRPDKYDKEVFIGNAEAAIVGPKGDTDYSIYISGGVQTKFVFISVIRYLFLRKIECDLVTLPIELQELFKDTTGKKGFLFSAPIAPSSISLMKTFENEEYGLSRKLEIEAIHLNKFLLNYKPL